MTKRTKNKRPPTRTMRPPKEEVVVKPTGDHGHLFEKNVRYHNKDGSTCLVTYGSCKEKPLDVKIYTER